MVLKKNPKVILVDYGVANNFGKHIEINRELLAYPDLYDYILNHELGHSEGKHNFQDVKNDFLFNPMMVLRLMLFVAVRPKTWIELLPIFKREGKWIYDKGMILSYSILLICIIIAFLVF